MSKGMLMTCPIIVINLGGEMIYILEQRLKAQAVSFEKSCKVLNDVTKTLFSDEFVTKLFEPQKMYSINFSRQLIEKVVHCSIMKLNETSMGKLFDLMLMGLKHQILASTSPHEMYKITLNHLDGIKKILKDDPAAKCVENTREKFINKYIKLSAYDFICIKQEIHRFFQDKQIRVSVFLQENIQNNDGTIVIKNREFGPPFFDVPGTIRTFRNLGPLKSENLIEIKSAKGFSKNKVDDFYAHDFSDLGFNLYSENRAKKTDYQEKPDSAEKDYNIIKAPERSYLNHDELLKNHYKVEGTKAKNELNTLAALIKGASENKDDTFKLNIFPERKPGSSAKGQASSKDDDIIYFDLGPAKKGDDFKNNILGEFQDLNLDKESETTAGNNDLLDLMDSLH